MLHVKSCRIVSTFRISNSLEDLMILVNGQFLRTVLGNFPGNVPNSLNLRPMGFDTFQTNVFLTLLKTGVNT